MMNWHSHIFSKDTPYYFSVETKAWEVIKNVFPNGDGQKYL